MKCETNTREKELFYTILDAIAVFENCWREKNERGTKASAIGFGGMIQLRQ